MVAAVGAVPTSPLATRTQGCAGIGPGSGCPTWPAAVHMEGTYTNVNCNSANPKPAPTCITGVGHATWDTLGDESKPAQ
eukprot:SAG25_NODE_7958_length_448_cov_1.031519_1_plen_78_part_10